MATDTATEVPTAPGSFLLGSMPALRRDVLGTFERARAAHGDLVRFRAGPRRSFYGAFHPDAAHQVLAGSAANYRKDSLFYTELRTLIGDGLLTSQDELWQRQKRFVQPLFTPRRVLDYADGIGRAAAELVGDWPDRILLHEEMTRLTLNIVCRALFGSDAADVMPVVRKEFEPLVAGVQLRSTGLAFPLRIPTPVNRRARAARRALYEVCDRIIARRRAAGGTGERDDLMSRLLDARVDGAALDDVEIRDQVLIFLLAGHETTSTALTYTLHLLGGHPDIQRRVREEVTAVLGDRAPSAADAGALTYTTMVLKEAMRLFPSAPIIGRRTVEADRICGYDVPAGADVLVAPWVVHRHPDFWPDPLRFDPERFTPAAEQERHRYAWLPFGGGPRACIGQRFSMLESVLVLAVLLRDFAFTAPPGQPPHTLFVTLRPVGGVPSTVVKINRR